MIEAIGIAAAIVGGVSLLIGLLLGFAGRVFYVKVDERIEKVRAALPGSNCGGCGFAGCDACAAAIVAGEAPVNACPGGDVEAIAAVMGVEASADERLVAYVHCTGTCDKAVQEYNYYGAADCRQAAMAPGHAGKACSYGCFGLGSCVKVCPSDAISICDGVAVVDESKCISCRQCVNICPQHIISMRPESAAVEVCCSSNAPGKEVKAVCSGGCIGCGICQKQCPADAIHVENNLARVDHDKCTGCGVCQEKCPVKVIHLLQK